MLLHPSITDEERQAKRKKVKRAAWMCWYARNKKRVHDRVAAYYKANPEKKKATARKEYANNRDKYLTRAAAYYKANSDAYKSQIRARKAVDGEFLNKYRTDNGCKRCGEKDLVVLDFHHREPVSNDRSNSYRLANTKGMSRKRIEEEIAKCDVLCANCHCLTEHENRPARRGKGGKHTDLLRSIKAERGCRECGFKVVPCLHFHHIDPTTKLGVVAQMVGRPIKDLLAEVAKCEILCANCHRREHAKEGSR